jgi:hypothetical protein
MSENYTWTMSRGTIFEHNRVYILGYSGREPGTRVFRWTGKWDNYHVPCTTGGICSVRGPHPEILTMCLDGVIHSAGPNGFSTEFVDRTSEGPIHRGVLREIRAVGPDVFVVGLGRQVYRRRRAGVWERWDQGVVDPLGSDRVVGFESIDGFGGVELYAVGLAGEIWFHDGKGWSQVNSPTNVVLEKVTCSPDGRAYIGGQLGILIRGRGDAWEIVEHEATEETFWDMAWFDGRLWLSTTEALFTLHGDELKEVDMGLKVKPSCRYLDAADGALWSFGSKNLVYFDRTTWNEVPLP